MLIKSLLDTGMSHLSIVTFKLNLHLKLIFQKFQSGSILIVLRIFLIVLIVCVCTCTCMCICVWSENNLQELILTFYHVGSRKQDPLIRLDDMDFYEPSH